MKKELIRDAAGVVGLAMLGYGLSLIYYPSAFVVVGAILTWLALKGV